MLYSIYDLRDLCRHSLYSRSCKCLYADVGTKYTEIMTWEEMYNNSLQVIQELYREIETLRAIVRVQLPIVERDDECE